MAPMNGLAPRNGLQAAVMPNGEVRTFMVRECSASGSVEEGVQVGRGSEQNIVRGAWCIGATGRKYM